jgi:hypothetical protein
LSTVNSMCFRPARSAERIPGEYLVVREELGSN